MARARISEMLPLLLTRPEALSREFAGIVAARMPARFAPIISPLMQITSEPCSLDISEAQALLFSSRNAVAEFAARSSERHLPALCVGDRTAEDAEKAGFSAMSASGDVSDLMVLAENSYLPDHGMFLHFRGSESVGDLAGSLNAAGIPAEDRIIYDRRPLSLTEEAKTALSGPETVIAPVFSPRTAAHLCTELLENPDTHKILAIALSQKVADRIDPTTNARILTANSPDAEAVIAVLNSLNVDALSRV